MVGIGPKQPPSRKGESIAAISFMSVLISFPGSMQDLPQNLLQQIKDFEDMFTVDRAKLKQIVNHFVKELEKGMFLSKITGTEPLC